MSASTILCRLFLEAVHVDRRLQQWIANIFAEGPHVHAGPALGRDGDVPDRGETILSRVWDRAGPVDQRGPIRSCAEHGLVKSPMLAAAGRIGPAGTGSGWAWLKPLAMFMALSLK